jgi:hypothetical protein
MKALFALVLVGVTTVSLAQAKEYTNNELSQMTPKVTYACPLPNYQDFELRVMTKNTILSNSDIYRLAANEVSEPFFFEGPNYASITVPAVFLKGSLPKIEIGIGGYSTIDSGKVTCYRISK